VRSSLVYSTFGGTASGVRCVALSVSITLPKNPAVVSVHTLSILGYWRQKWWKLIEDLSRKDNTCRAHGQAGNVQSLRRPRVAGVAEIVRSSRGIEDALGIGAGTNVAGRRFIVRGQIVPQKLRQTLDAIPRHVDKNSVGSTEKGFRRDLEWNDKHDCRSRGERSQNVPYTGISSHVVIARAPAEDKVTCARKLRLQSGRRTTYLRHG
jgi:hypothetical protein